MISTWKKCDKRWKDYFKNLKLFPQAKLFLTSLCKKSSKIAPQHFQVTLSRICVVPERNKRCSHGLSFPASCQPASQPPAVASLFTSLFPRTSQRRQAAQRSKLNRAPAKEGNEKRTIKHSWRCDKWPPASTGVSGTSEHYSDRFLSAESQKVLWPQYSRMKKKQEGKSWIKSRTAINVTRSRPGPRQKKGEGRARWMTSFIYSGKILLIFESGPGEAAARTVGPGWERKWLRWGQWIRVVTRTRSPVQARPGVTEGSSKYAYVSYFRRNDGDCGAHSRWGMVVQGVNKWM